jgi:hypothetical protein
VTAVVGRSLNNLLWDREYDYGVDGSVRQLEMTADGPRETGFGFDFQSKSTITWEIDNGDIVYDLEAAAYNNLVRRTDTGASPFFLVLLCLHKDTAEWLDIAEEKMTLAKCTYWVHLKGASIANTSTKRIRIPRSNVFDPGAVSQLLSDIRSGVLVP